MDVIFTLLDLFQSTHPCGVRPLLAQLQNAGNSFQSTHPCGVRPSMRSNRIWRREFQSTHPCGVRLNDVAGVVHGQVSIHAPVWGATCLRLKVQSILTFQSTHPCGVRLRISRWCVIYSSFNPRTRVGCDDCDKKMWLGLLVSIHAPVWGATRVELASETAVSFNPRTRVGCDVCYPNFRVFSAFQSTHPCGVRQARGRCGISAIVSIHAPVWGATTLAKIESVKQDVSIHAPVWGATLKNLNQWRLAMFQSTHPCGVRRITRQSSDTGRAFQSTHPCGVRPFMVNPSLNKMMFQSTHPCGVRPSLFAARLGFKTVSIHAPVWGATNSRLTSGFFMECFNPRTRVGCDPH